MPDERNRLLWRRTRRVTVLLLTVWLAANLAGPWFARALNGVTVAGLPLGYWLAAQGLLLLYLLIIVLYVVYMNRLEARARDQTQAQVVAAPQAPE